MAKEKIVETEHIFLSHIQQFIGEKSQQTKYLLAVSGGMDSVTMLYLMHKLGFDIAVAHVNFNLRGEESNEDAAFVAKLAQKYKVPYFETSFDTADYAKQQGISIQMAARALRYAWFEYILAEYEYNILATAHHAQDAVETMFINMLRGSGIAGLAGIPVRQGKIFRPMLCLNREQIQDIVATQQLSWREDSSNASSYYARNFIRLEILPLLNQKFDQAEYRLMQSAGHIAEAEQYIQQQLQNWELQYVQFVPHFIRILKAGYNPENQYLAKRFLLKYGLNKHQIDQLIHKAHQSGSRFTTPVYTLTVDRGDILIESVSAHVEPQEIYISRQAKTYTLPNHIQLVTQILPHIENVPQSAAAHEVYLQMDLLKFPLKLRRWKEGDRIKPLGMAHYKKVSDVLIDKKIARPQKDKTWVLMSEDQIVWVVGVQMSDAFKITDIHKSIFHITLATKNT